MAYTSGQQITGTQGKRGGISIFMHYTIDSKILKNKRTKKWKYKVCSSTWNKTNSKELYATFINMEELYAKRRKKACFFGSDLNLNSLDCSISSSVEFFWYQLSTSDLPSCQWTHKTYENNLHNYWTYHGCTRLHLEVFSRIIKSDISDHFPVIATMELKYKKTELKKCTTISGVLHNNTE